MALNKNVNPRPLTPKEKEDRKHGVYDSFANYVVFCNKCKKTRKTVNEYMINVLHEEPVDPTLVDFDDTIGW